MKKILTLIPIIALLAACGHTDKLADRADDVYKRDSAEKKQSIQQTPSWYKNKPEISKNGIFAYGVGEAKDRNHAEFLARQFAYSKLCMSTGGTVSQKGNVYQNQDAVVSELIIRSSCKQVSLDGIESHLKEEFAVGNRYQVFVQIVLPTGEANVVKKSNESMRLQELAVQRASDEFKKKDNE